MANAWILQIFDSRQARDEGVARRATRDVEQQGGGIGELIAEAQGRGFHVIETGDQMVVLCHAGVLKLHC